MHELFGHYYQLVRNRKYSQEEADAFFLKIQLKPLVPYVNSGTPRKCKCLVCGSIVNPRLGDVKKAKSCVKCQGKKLALKIRLSDQEVLKSAKQMRIRLLEPYVDSRTPIKARCLVCKNQISPTIGRLRAGVGCTYCGRVKSAKSRLLPMEGVLKDFAEAKLELLEEYTNSHQAVKVRCLVCGKTSTKTYQDLKQGKRCYTCGRAQASLNRRLNQEYMAAIALLQNLKPVGQINPVRQNSTFECLKCHRKIQMSFSSIQNGSSCRFCSRTEIDPKEAYAYMVKNHLKPQEPFKKSATKWKCRCMKCKNIVYPKFNAVSTFGGGCKFCRSAGYNPSFEGHLYLLHNPTFDSYKLGISNIKSRIRRHELLGWVVVNKWDFEDGRIPPLLEECLLIHVRNKWNLPWSVLATDMPQGGHTETFSAIGLPEQKVLRLINSKIRSTKVEES